MLEVSFIRSTICSQKLLAFQSNVFSACMLWLLYIVTIVVSHATTMHHSRTCMHACSTGSILHIIMCIYLHCSRYTHAYPAFILPFIQCCSGHPNTPHFFGAIYDLGSDVLPSLVMSVSTVDGSPLTLRCLLQNSSITVRHKMFAINNFREWSTFANIIITNFYVRTYTVYDSTL